MTDKKISELASAGAIGAADLIELVQSGGTGGALGDAIHGNSYITWVATGTRYGAIV